MDVTGQTVVVVNVVRVVVPGWVSGWVASTEAARAKTVMNTDFMLMMMMMLEGLTGLCLWKMTRKKLVGQNTEQERRCFK